MILADLPPTQQRALRDAIDHASLLRVRGGYRHGDSTSERDVHTTRAIYALRRNGLLALTHLGDVAFATTAGRELVAQANATARSRLHGAAA